MKSKVKKIALNRETLRSLADQGLADAAGGATRVCYPETYGESCFQVCPIKGSGNCA